jgi:hypothetical protein
MELFCFENQQLKRIFGTLVELWWNFVELSKAFMI